MIRRAPQPPGGERRGRGWRPLPGSEGGPRPAGEILQGLLRSLRIEERSRQGRVASAWLKAAGEDLASRARPVAFRAGLLTVEVDGAGLLLELKGFRGPALLEAVRAEPGGGVVREIRWVPAGRAGAGGGERAGGGP